MNLTNTPGVNEYGATWSPDGSRLAHLNVGLRIVDTMAADGSDVQVAAPGLRGAQFVPAWQPLQRRGRQARRPGRAWCPPAGVLGCGPPRAGTATRPYPAS